MLTSVQASNNLASILGAIFVQYLRDMLYAFLENHSNSLTVKSCCAGVLGLRREALACEQARRLLADSFFPMS